jgi:hypothetical protein
MLTTDTSRPGAAAPRDLQAARARFLSMLASVPDEALGYRPEGEDYALSGLVEHVAGVMRHYARVLAACREAGDEQIRVGDATEDQDMRAVQSGFVAAGRRESLAQLAAAHTGLLAQIEQLVADEFTRSTPVVYGTASEPSATSAADVVGWVAQHYQEHAQHIADLLDRWSAEGTAAVSDARSVIERFNAAFNAHDVDAIMALMTDDCVFEDTEPAPDGTRFVGQAAVRQRWEELFTASPHAVFSEEELFLAGDRAVVRWRYDWGDGHVRGVDILRMREGRVAEKFSYVKG